MHKRSSFNALSWSFVDNILQQVVNFVIGIILARLLMPEQFGVVGIITVFIAISNVFVNVGLGDALINKNNAKDIDYHTVFWSNIILGVSTYIIIFLLAPYIQDYFSIEKLSFYIRLTAVSILFVSLSSIQRVILTKEVNFKVIAKVSFASVIVSGLVAIIMAYQNYGVLSLVIRMTLGQFLTMVLFIIFNRWLPKWQFSKRAFAEMFNFGINLFFSRLLNAIYNNIYYFVVGKIFSPSILGYYTRAENFKNVASTNITSTVQRVSFSILSKQETFINKEQKFLKFILVTTLLTFFFMAILFSCSEEIILLLVGEKWLVSAEYLKILAVSGLFLPLFAMNINFLAVIKKTKEFLQLEVISKILAIPAVFIGMKYGIHALLYSIVGVSLISFLITFIKLKNYSLMIVKKECLYVFKILLFVIIPILLLELIGVEVVENNILRLGIKLTIISLSFFSGIMVFFPEIKFIIKGVIKNGR